MRRDTALAWLERHYLERRAALLDALQRENALFTAAIDAQLAAGRALPADALGPRAEATELADRRDELDAALARSRAGLRRWVGAAGDGPLAGEPPDFAIDGEHLRTHVHEHPDLAVFAPMTAMAQAEVHAAEAARRPDWGVELSYGRRASPSATCSRSRSRWACRCSGAHDNQWSRRGASHWRGSRPSARR